MIHSGNRGGTMREYQDDSELLTDDIISKWYNPSWRITTTFKKPKIKRKHKYGIRLLKRKLK